jgi:hypothetical protein
MTSKTRTRALGTLVLTALMATVLFAGMRLVAEDATVACGCRPFTPSYSEIWSIADARGEDVLLRIQEGNRTGYINRNGQIVIPPQFLNGRAFSEGYASVLTEEGWTFIDTQGRFTTDRRIPIEPGRVSSGLAWFATMGGVWKRYGYIDPLLNVIVPPKYDHAGDFMYGVACVETIHMGRSKTFWIDRNGNKIDRCCCDLSLGGTLCLQPVKRAGKYGYSDCRSRMVIQPQFDDAGVFYQGISTVRIGDELGFIDRSGSFIIAPQNREAKYFSQGRCAVMIDNKWGYIDLNNDMVIPPIFLRAEAFGGGVADVVFESGVHGYIDLAGKRIWPPPQE